MAKYKVVKFCTQVSYINSSNMMTYHQRNRVFTVTWLFENIAVSRDAARRAGLSATAKLLVDFVATAITSGGETFGDGQKDSVW